MTHHLRAVWLIVTILLTTIIPLATPTTVNASCYGSSCNGVYVTSTCRNGEIIVAQMRGLARHYSPTCNAYYAIAWPTYYSEYSYVSAWMEANEDATATINSPPYSTSATSRMWDSGRACAWDTSNGGATRCI